MGKATLTIDLSLSQSILLARLHERGAAVPRPARDPQSHTTPLATRRARCQALILHLPTRSSLLRTRPSPSYPLLSSSAYPPFTSLPAPPLFFCVPALHLPTRSSLRLLRTSARQSPAPPRQSPAPPRQSPPRPQAAPGPRLLQSRRCRHHRRCLRGCRTRPRSCWRIWGIARVTAGRGSERTMREARSPRSAPFCERTRCLNQTWPAMRSGLGSPPAGRPTDWSWGRLCRVRHGSERAR